MNFIVRENNRRLILSSFTYFNPTLVSILLPSQPSPLQSHVASSPELIPLFPTFLARVQCPGPLPSPPQGSLSLHSISPTLTVLHLSNQSPGFWSHIACPPILLICIQMG